MYYNNVSYYNINVIHYTNDYNNNKKQYTL